MKKIFLNELDQDYMFTLDAIMALVPFACPEKFYSHEVIELHEELFESMQKSGHIDENQKFKPYQLTDELFKEIINQLKVKVPKKSQSKKLYISKLDDLLKGKISVSEVIEFFSEERIRLDKLIYSTSM